MRTIVNVISNVNGIIKVGCSSSACSGCHSESFCRNKDTQYEVNNPLELVINKGDTVEVEIPEKKALFTVFMSLLFPLLMFLPGYFLGRKISDNEITSALFGILFIALGFLISYLFFRGRKKEFSPYIVRKL